MKTSLLRLGAVVAVSIGALAIPTAASAGGGGGLCSPNSSGDIANCRFSGLVAEAGFGAGSFDSTATNASLFVLRGRALGAGSGPPTDQASTMVFISKVHANPDPWMKPTTLVDIFGYLPSASGFSIDNSLQRASLSPTTIPVSGYDESGPLPAGSTVTVSAAWTGSGPIARSTVSFTYRSGGYTTTERFVSDLRYATASASIELGANDWMSGLTQNYADIQSSTDTSLTIIHS